MSAAAMSVDVPSATEDTNDSTVTMNLDRDAGKEALLAFWAEHRLSKVEEFLREFLGTETLSDLDDVHPCDLQTLRACQWAEARLTVAEANRLKRAVKVYHAQKHAYPEPGVTHTPRCQLCHACACQNMDDTPCVLERTSSILHDHSVSVD